METNYQNDPKHFKLAALILQIEHLHWMSFLHPIVDAASGGPTGPPHLPIEGRQHSTKLDMVVRISATRKGFRSKSSPNSPRRFSFNQKNVAARSGVVSGLERPQWIIYKKAPGKQ